MNRIDRLFGISTLLQSRKYIAGEKIASHFGISVRTVYRDIKALTEQGIPIGFEANKGYFIVQGYFLPPVAFNMEEANALLLVEKLIAGFSDKSISNHYTAALDKIRAALKPAQREKLEAHFHQIQFQLPQCFVSDFEYLSPLQHAISNSEIVEIIYKSKKEEVSTRRIECIGLIYYAFSWHVIAWCHSRLDYRDFNITRIIKIENLSTSFTKKDHIQVGEYMKMLPVNY